MEKIKLKKPLNLHKFNVKLTSFTLNLKIEIPIIFTFIGIWIGATLAEGESNIYLNICRGFNDYISDIQNCPSYMNLLLYILIPSVFAILVFFSGLTVFGAVTVNLIPLVYGTLASSTIYYLYNSYELKGLAYIVMMYLPYIIPSTLALILMCAESTSMSQGILKTVSRTKRNNDYNFNMFYIRFLKSYLLIIAAAIIKTIMENLFSGLIIF